MQNFFQCDRDGAGVPKHHHSKRIAHQNNRNARAIDDLGRGVIVGCNHWYALAAQFHFLKIENGRMHHPPPDTAIDVSYTS
jgi:hypothetical protein